MSEPKHIGKYEIIEEIGRGGFATVYRALDTTLDREIALKVLHPQLLTDQAFVQRFRREARALARLRHPHIITVYEVGEAEANLYIAMELARGPSLADSVAKVGCIPWQEALALLGPMCDALDYAHKQGIVHRDLKPSNVLLDKERGPLLADFGIARLVSGSSVSLTTGGIVGTPAYIAPEVWDENAADASADIYALGCIVYEMLTGDILFAGATPMQSMRSHDKGPQFCTQWPEGVPDEIDRALQNALAHNPADRFASAGEMLDALRHITVPAKVAETPESDHKVFPWKWIGGIGAAVMAVLCLVGAVIVLTSIDWSADSAATLTAVALASTNTPTKLAATATAMPISTATETNTPVPTHTPIPSNTLTSTPTPTDTPRPEPTATTTSLPTVTPTPKPKAGATRIWGGDGALMVYVPEGTFWMGSTDADVDDAFALCTQYYSQCKREWFERGTPQHQVYLDAFWIDQTEVTNAQYRLCEDVGVCSPPSQTESATRARYYDNLQFEDYPVIYVGWSQADMYCRWANKRLPTEAEWEKAARGTAGQIYPWGSNPDGTRLNHCDLSCGFEWKDPAVNDGYDDTAPVGSYPVGASPYGVLDMSGNVWEWVADWYDKDYYTRSPTENPSGPSSGNCHVLRGGSWHNSVDNAQCAFRNEINTDEGWANIGFRCAVSASSP